MTSGAHAMHQTAHMRAAFIGLLILHGLIHLLG